MRAKKIAALGLSMALCLSACAGKDTVKDVTGDGAQTQETAVSEDNAASGDETADVDDGRAETGENVTEESGESEEPVGDENALRTPILYVEASAYDSFTDEDTYFTYAYVSGVYPWIETEGYDELKAALREQNTKDWNGIRSTLDNAKESVNENTEEDMEYMKNLMPWYSEDRVEFVRSDDLVFSYWIDEGTWLGGAHPYSYRAGRNFDSATGKLLDLKDITEDYDAFYELAVKKIKDTKDTSYYYDEWEDTVKNMFYAEDYSIEWTVSYEGINLYFNSYSLMPYAGGPVSLLVSFDECSELVKADYIGHVSERLLHCLDTDEYDSESGAYRYKYDRDGDGTPEISVSVSQQPHYNSEYEYYDYTDLTIECEKDGNESVYTSEISTYMGSWIIEDEKGDFYLYIEELSDNDWHAMQIFDLNGQSIKCLDYNESGAFYDIKSHTPGHIFVTTRLYIMGTHHGITECEIGRSGQLISKDGEYKVVDVDSADAIDDPTVFEDVPEYVYNTEITAYTDISDMIYYEDINDRDTFEKRDIPEGTVLIPVVTDGEKYMIFKVKDGDGYFRIDYDEEGYHMINGVEETDCLSNLMYAG